MKALVLDFDGVISDSAREAFVVALRTHLYLRPDSGHRAALAALDPAQPEASPLYPAFLDLMPLGNRAEDFEVSLLALDRGATIDHQEAYDAFRASLDPDHLRAFHRRFYEVRADWSESDPAGWRRTLAPYPGMIELLRRRAGQTQLAIATAKDRTSVKSLLVDYGVADLFREEHVLDKETGVSKRAHLEHLQAELDVPFKEITFVDDKVNHLDDVAPLGVRPALATWGYNGRREHRLAETRRYLLLTMADAEAQLFGDL